MKLTYQAAALAGVLILVGCDRPGTRDNNYNTNNPPAVSTNSSLKTEMRDAGDATKAFFTQNKDEYAASMDKKLQKMDQKIADLDAQANSRDNAAAKTALDNLRDKRAKLNQKLDEVKQANNDAWKDLKAGFESAMDDLDRAYDDAKARLTST